MSTKMTDLKTYRVTANSFALYGSEKTVYEVKANGFTLDNNSLLFWTAGEDGMNFRSAAIDCFDTVECIGEAEFEIIFDGSDDQKEVASESPEVQGNVDDES